MRFITNFQKCDENHFTNCGRNSILSTQSQKTIVSREKLDKHMANISAPCAFFIRDLRTPKQILVTQFEPLKFAPMVGRRGQSLAVGCVPYVTVSHPFTFYRQIVRSLAADPNNIHMETAKMLFKFLLLGAHRLTITIRAKSEQQARQQLQLDRNAVCIARINTKFTGGYYA